MPRQILLADDSATIARMVQITFAHEDYTVTAVKSGEEAIARARGSRPDVVLVDAGLQGPGGRNGYDLCADLRAAGVRDVPVLLLTNNFVPYDEARGQRAGADGFVVKPFETQALIDRVAQVIGSPRSAAAVAAAAAPPSTRAPLSPTVTPGPQVAVPRPVPVPNIPAATAPTVQMQAPSLRPPIAAPPPAAPIVAQPPPAARPAIATPTTPQPTARAAIPTPHSMPVQGGPEPSTRPRATLMGLPTMGPDGLPIPMMSPVAPVRPVQPIQPVTPPIAQPVIQPIASPIAVAPPPARAEVAPERQTPTVEMAAPVLPAKTPAPAATPARAEAPKPIRPEPSTPIRIDTPSRTPRPIDFAGDTATYPGPTQPRMSETPASVAAVRKAQIPANAPKMPRPSLVPNAPTAEELRAILKSVGDGVSRPGQALGTNAEYEAIARLSREVIEQIAWEVVPELAEILIKAQIDKLVRERARG